MLDALKHLEFEAHDLNNDTRWEWSFASDVLSRIGHAAATPHLETIRFTVYARNASENSLSGDGYAALFPDDLMFFKGPENCWESLAQCVTVRGAALYLIVFTPYPKSSCRLQSLENRARRLFDYMGVDGTQVSILTYSKDDWSCTTRS